MDRTRGRNDALLRLAGTSGGFFFPVCSVHPADGQAALAELDRVAAAGCAWLKLHPNTQAFDVADPAVREVVARATEHRLPVLFDAYQRANDPTPEATFQGGQVVVLGDAPHARARPLTGGCPWTPTRRASRSSWRRVSARSSEPPGC